MKFRHAAALALVGWYLMVPPWGKTDAPISKWHNYKPFDSAAACQAERDGLAEHLTKQGKDHVLTIHTESSGDSKFDPSAATCIGTDHPRLKNPRSEAQPRRRARACGIVPCKRLILAELLPEPQYAGISRIRMEYGL